MRLAQHASECLVHMQAAMATTMALQYWHYGPAALVASPAIPAALGALLGAQVGPGGTVLGRPRVSTRNRFPLPSARVLVRCCSLAPA